jgi:hypothetical protein
MITRPTLRRFRAEALVTRQAALPLLPHRQIIPGASFGLSSINMTTRRAGIASANLDNDAAFGRNLTPWPRAKYLILLHLKIAVSVVRLGPWALFLSIG